MEVPYTNCQCHPDHEPGCPNRDGLHLIRFREEAARDANRQKQVSSPHDAAMAAFDAWLRPRWEEDLAEAIRWAAERGVAVAPTPDAARKYREREWARVGTHFQAKQ